MERDSRIVYLNLRMGLGKNFPRNSNFFLLEDRMRFTLATLFLAVVPGFSANQPDRPLPLFFFPNTGQADSSVQYLVQTPDLCARFRPGEAIFHVHGQQVGVRFLGANPAVSIGGLDPLAAKVNFFLGTAAWKTDVPTYSKVVYRDLYPGIDMTYGGIGRQMKSEFLVAAGANLGLIRLEYSEPVSLDAQGNLISGDLFRENAPEVYQQIGAARVKIDGRYRLLDQHTVGFEIGPYDASLPLVIDPTISYCSYLGGSSTTAITGIALDSSANLYMTGWTEALNFPIDGPYQAANAGGVDVIVAKLSAAGTGLLYATYIGGKSDDKGAAIAVDNLGQAYVTGTTSSSNFPLVSSNRATLGGSTTVFVLKLNATGNRLLYSGYLGGTTWEVGTAIAVDSSYNAYIAGDTQSPNFPTKNGTQTNIGGNTDAFITKLNPAGGYAFSTFLGGVGNEHAGGIAVDSLGDIFVAGGTSSSNFPVVSPLQASLAGTQNAFVAKISYAGAVAFSTYLGGSGGTLQQANAIALDSAGNPYIAGVTNSVSFPVTAGAFQIALNGEQSAFVTKMTATGSAFVYSTYLGGDVSDWASGIAVNAAGNAYVAGWTSSVNFPQASPVQAVFGGLTDAFISEFNFAGNGLLFSTYYGGSGSDSVNAIALDSNANIFTGGQTSSQNLPLVLPIESTTAASSTGWFLRLGVTALPPTIPSVTSVSPTSGTGSTVTFTATFADTGGGSTLSTAALLVNASASTGSGCYVSYNPGMNLFSLYNDAGTAVLYTVAPGGAIIANDQCELSGIGSSATVSGTTLTVTFSLIFQPSFPGAKTVYLQAGDASSTTGWLAQGTFTVTVPAGLPTVNSVTPNANSGSGATFTFVYGDTVYARSLTAVAFLFNTSVNFSNACYVVWDLTANTIALIGDNGSGSSSVTLGSSTSLHNSQCVVNGGATSAVSGLSMILTISITFNSGFTGTKNIYMYAAAGSVNTGWVLEGTYGSVTGGAPVANSAVPASGSGPSERFTFIVSDQGGGSYLTAAAILFAPTLNFVNACYLIWDGTRNTISLTYDNPANGQTPLTPGQPGIATNDECTMNAANSTVIVSGTRVIITLDLTFNDGFAGLKNIYLYAAEAFTNSGWTTVGTWTASGGAPTANSVSPSSGSGSSATFVFTETDSSSQVNLTGMTMLLTSGAPSAIANACYLVYNRTAATIGLWDNTGNTTLTTKGLGSSTTLQNSQCAVGYTVTLVSGNSITFSIQLVFNTTNFPGVKSIYLQATEPTASSGFVYEGTWTVP